jgi:hypothetical protein
VNEDRLHAFLSDSLALWHVEGVVEAGQSPVVGIVRTHPGAVVWIERVSGADVPYRWAVRSRTAGAAPGGPREVRAKPCASLVGLLKALRDALGVERGSAVRIAPPPGNRP